MKIKNNFLKDIINTFLSHIEIYDEHNFNQQKWHFLNVDYMQVKDKFMTIKKNINKHCFFNVMGFLLLMYEYDAFSKTLVVDNIYPGSKQAIFYYHGWSSVTKRYNLFNWLPGFLTNGFMLSRNFLTLKSFSKNRFAKLNIKYNKQTVFALGDTPDLVILNSSVFFDHIVVKEATKMHLSCINFLSVNNFPGNSVFRLFDNNLIIENYTKYVWLLKRVMFFGKIIGLNFLNEKQMNVNSLYIRDIKVEDVVIDESLVNLNLFKLMVLKNIFRDVNKQKPKKLNIKRGFEFYFRFFNWGFINKFKKESKMFIDLKKYFKLSSKSSGFKSSFRYQMDYLRKIESYGKKIHIGHKNVRLTKEEKVQIDRRFLNLERGRPKMCLSGLIYFLIFI